MIPLLNALTPKSNKALQNQYIESLEIHKNSFNDEIKKYLCLFLESNTTLSSLKISGYWSLMDKTNKSVANSLKRNRALTHLDIGKVTEQ